jgi:integrase/recombinase XerC
MAILLNMRPDSEVEPKLAGHLDALRMRNQRPRSIRERRLTVLRVARFLGHPVASATEAELKAWQVQRTAKLEPSSRHNEIVHVACYLGWLHYEGLIEYDPSLRLDRPKKLNQRLPAPTMDADIARALAAAEQPLHVWLCLAAFCGLRCMEIAAMRREWIVPGPPAKLRVIGKGDKERVVPLPLKLLDELTSGPFNASGHLFDRMDGKPGPPSAMRVSERINDHLHAVGVASTAHKLRHRFGTEMYRLTKDPFKVAGYMGHASVDTTRGYVLLAADDSADLAAAIAELAG